MTARPMPKVMAPLVDGRAVIREPWVGYLRGIEEMSREADALAARATTLEGRKAALVADLAASPTVEDIGSAFNDLLAKLKAANLMETV